MNTSSTLARSCARQCRTAHSIPPISSSSQPARRALSSTSSTHAYATTTSTLPSDQNKPPPTHLFTGTVTRTGTMQSTVQITRQRQIFDKFLQKHYTRPLRLKASDPNPAGFLREGDVVEYGYKTQEEKDAKARLDQERVEKEEKRLAETDRTGKALRRFQRTEALRKKLKGEKERGVLFVVRRVVTPFGVGLDERLERLGLGQDQNGVIGQESSRLGGQDSLAKGLGGNTSRHTARAAVAG